MTAVLEESPSIENTIIVSKPSICHDSEKTDNDAHMISIYQTYNVSATSGNALISALLFSRFC